MKQSTYIWSIIALTFLWLPAVPAAGQEASAVNPKQVSQTYRQLPLSFEANQGQTDKRVRFLARSRGYSLFLTGSEAVLMLQKRQGGGAALRMRPMGANRGPAVSGLDPLPGRSNYFIGNDPRQWHTNVPTYAAVKYAGVYPGIDLVYHGHQGKLEYDFVVAPGADPHAIELSFEGATNLSLNRAGELVIGLSSGEVIEHAPVVYQDVGGHRQLLPACGYVLLGRGRVGFKVEAYDRTRPLVIDPTLAYSTYLGGSGQENGITGAFGSNDFRGIAVDASGNAYVTGSTSSSNFPTTAGAFRTTNGGSGDAFVSKLNAAGSALLYSTFLGGSDFEDGHGIAVDGTGNAYVTGATSSSNFPTTPGAFQTTSGGNSNSDAFVSKLNATGSALLYSTYLGGSFPDLGTGIAVDPSGNAYVTGATSSSNFPATPGAFQTFLRGDVSDSFVSKLNAAGSALLYSTYLGGSNDLGFHASGDEGHGIAVDSSANAYVTGQTSSSDFPTTPGAFQTTFQNNFEGSTVAFVSKLNATGSALLYSTYLGGFGGDSGSGIAVDVSGNAYVTGVAEPLNFPTTPGAFQTSSGGFEDAFVSKLNAAGSALLYCTFLGGSGDDSSFGIAVDSSGDAYITGLTNSNNFPTTPNAFQATFGGGGGFFGDAFVSKLNAAGSALLYSTYLGGTGDDEGAGIAVDASGSAYITGTTESSNFPTTSNAFQTTSGGSGDAFVSKFSFGIPFSSFSGKLELDVDAGSFDLNASFTLGAGGSINPVTEPVSLTIGTYSVTIPARSFVEHKPEYAFEGVIDGVSLEVLIKFGSTAGSYTLLAEGRGANLKGTTNPVPVTLSIGNDMVTTKINAEFQ